MEFVYDRSAQDVLDRTKKGVLNADDLNRIESNSNEIGDKIAIPVTVKTWENGGLPRESDYLRIRNNVEAIRNGYGIKPSTPTTPTQPLNTYQKWNDIEKILFDVNDIYDGTMRTKIYCGEDVCCGDEIGVI